MHMTTLEVEHEYLERELHVQGALSSALSADQGLDHSAGTKSRISGVNVNVCMCVVFANGFNNPSDS